MSSPRYLWRKITPKQREELLAWRQLRGYPWHSPPHRPNYGHLHFLVGATCYEHKHYIGFTAERMDEFALELLGVVADNATRTVAWCVLPNHYHALVEAPDIKQLLAALGQLHGRTSFRWNGEDKQRGRKVFYRSVERYMRSERHFWATINYVHNNPVHHGYVRLWTEWQWSSASDFLKQMGRDEVMRLWREYPVREYGKKWDPPSL